MRGRESGFGQYLVGFIDAHDIPRKLICEGAHIHPSTFSRKVNGVEQFQCEEALAIGVVIGQQLRRAR